MAETSAPLGAEAGGEVDGRGGSKTVGRGGDAEEVYEIRRGEVVGGLESKQEDSENLNLMGSRWSC